MMEDIAKGTALELPHAVAAQLGELGASAESLVDVVRLLLREAARVGVIEGRRIGLEEAASTLVAMVPLRRHEVHRYADRIRELMQVPLTRPASVPAEEDG